MTEQKKLIYQLEDTFVLGKSLPVVAMRQLPRLAEKFNTMPDLPEHLTGTMKVMGDNIVEFYQDNKRYVDEGDERELVQVFTKACKSGLYSHRWFRMMQATMSL